MKTKPHALILASGLNGVQFNWHSSSWPPLRHLKGDPLGTSETSRGEGRWLKDRVHSAMKRDRCIIQGFLEKENERGRWWGGCTHVHVCGGRDRDRQKEWFALRNWLIQLIKAARTKGARLASRLETWIGARVLVKPEGCLPEEFLLAWDVNLSSIKTFSEMNETCAHYGGQSALLRFH